MKYLTKTIKSSDNIDAIKASLDHVADIVCSTMGPGGRTVAIHMPSGVMSTKDGVTVARYLNLKDKLDNMLAMMAIDAAGKTVKEVGDGTTSTVLLFKTIYNNLVESNGNIDKFAVCAGVDEAVEDVIQFINDNKVDLVVDGKIDIEALIDIAVVSANGDAELGLLIAELVSEVGENGILEVKDSSSSDTYSDKVDGYVFNTMPFKQFFGAGSGVMEFVNPFILLADIAISDYDEIRDIVNIWKDQCVDGGVLRPLVLIVSDIEGSALSTLTLAAKNGLPIMVVKAPAFGGMRYDYMKDLQLLTGANQVFSHITGNVFERFGKGCDYYEKNEFGQAAKVIMKKDKCIIVPANDKVIYGDDNSVLFLRKDVDSLVDSLKDQIEFSEYEGEKAYLKDRVSRLVSGMGTIYVGGNSDMEINYRKMVVDDVQRACFAALRNGIVPGCGITYIKSLIKIVTEPDNHRKFGYCALMNAMDSVFRKVCENMFISSVKVTDWIEEIGLLGFVDGINPANGQRTDFLGVGIVDPADVAISALKNAASVAKQLYLTEWILQLEDMQEGNMLGKLLYPERS
jgi:chaperonin GroEL